MSSEFDARLIVVVTCTECDTDLESTADDDRVEYKATYEVGSSMHMHIKTAPCATCCSRARATTGEGE